MQDPSSHLGQASMLRKLPQTLPLGRIFGSLVGGRSVERGKESAVWTGIVGPQGHYNVGVVGDPSPRNCNLGIGEDGHWERVFSVKASGKCKGGVVL